MSENVGEIDLRLILNSKQFDSQLKNVSGLADNASTQISSYLNKIGKAVAAAFSVTKIVQFSKECLKAAFETQNAWIGLNSILTGQGKSFNNAKAFINDYIKDGLVPLNNAIAAYKNLTLRGYNSDQIEKTMNALKNSATFARQSTYSLGEAVQTATEGLKNENSVVVDNAGVTKNVAKMWEDYAKSIGKTTNNLTQEEKIQAEVNGILEETKFQSKDASIYASTYSGKIAQLNSGFQNLKIAVGNFIQPIAKLFIPIITSAVNAVTRLFNALAGLLSLFGLKADSVETVSSGIEGIASGAENAANAVDGIGDSAAKASKKIKKALAGFDEIHTLNLSDDSDSSGSGSSGGGAGSSGIGDSVSSLDFSSDIKQDSSALDGIIGKAKELFGIFKEGFQISFGDTNFDGIFGHLNNLKDNLINIWTDTDVVNSMKQWVDTLLYSLGQVTGGVSRIAINVAEGFIGSIDKYISQNIDRIKTHICKMFDISSEDMALTGNLWEALGKISDVFSSDSAKQLGANIIAMFANPLMSAKENISKFAVDLRKIFVQPIVDNVDKIKLTLSNLLSYWERVTGTMSEALSYMGDKWTEIYDNSISPLMESLKVGFSDTFGKLLDVYNTYIAPFMDNVASGIQSLWEEHLKPYFDQVSLLWQSVVDAITVFWENILKPLVDWIIENVIPAVVPVLETIWNTVKEVFGDIIDAISGIIQAIRGIIDFIVGVFTGDWDKAWGGIKDIFAGIWNAISNILESIIDGIKGAIKTFVVAIYESIKLYLKSIHDYWNNIWTRVKESVIGIWNGMKTSISNAVTNIKDKIVNTFQTAYDKIKSIFSGIATFFTGIWDKIKNTFSDLGTKIGDSISGAVKAGINGLLGMVSNTVNGFINLLNGAIGVINAIPGVSINPLNPINIPMLAGGGYVKANTPQLAVVGDNKKEGEIISPESKIYEQTYAAARDAYKSVNSDKGGDVVVNVYLDNEMVERKRYKKQELINLATNGRGVMPNEI